MQDVKVSIIIPVYKVEEYLRECLDSVINQTLKDIEIICVDDGSPDGCGEILDEYAGKDSRVKVVHQENKGVSIARNVGIEISGGEYIYIMDSDDWLDLSAMETAYREAEKKNYELLFFNTCRYFQYSGKQAQSLVRKYYKSKPYKYWSGGAAWWCLIKRCVLVDNKDLRFPGNIVIGQDAIFTFKLYCKCSNVGIINDFLYYYRIRGGSAIFRGDNVELNFLSVKRYLDLIIDWIDTYGSWERDAPRFISYINRQVNSYVLRNDQYDFASKCKVFSQLRDTLKRVIPLLGKQDELILRKELSRLKRISLLNLFLAHFYRKFKKLLYKEELWDRNKVVSIVGIKFLVR